MEHLSYIQDTGEIYDHTGQLIGVGYSGLGAGADNPDMEKVRGVGPLPAAHYKLGSPYDHRGPKFTEQLGPFVMDLIPEPDQDTFGRSAFRVHGGKGSEAALPYRQRTASHGCIVTDHSERVGMHMSADHCGRRIRVYHNHQEMESDAN